MIKEDTVLILGAGASCPFKFPGGDALSEQIFNELNTESSFLFKVLRNLGYESDLIWEFRNTLHGAGFLTIDRFLQKRPDFLDIGKSAIAAILLPYEVKSNLFGFKNNWYKYIFQTLTEGTTKETLLANRLKIVTFNYDRSLEHFLHTSIKNAFKVNDVESAELLKSIEIFHIHGQLGYLPWQPFRKEVNEVPYDCNKTSDIHLFTNMVEKAFKSIQLALEDSPPINARGIDIAQQVIQFSKNIYILGFGYDIENLRKLNFQYIKGQKTIKGTSKGLTLQIKELFLNFVNNPDVYLGPNQTHPEIELINDNIWNFLHYNIVFK